MSAIGAATSMVASLVVPFGVSGAWSLAFREEFEGSSLSTPRWLAGGDTGSGGGAVPSGGTPDPGNVFDGFAPAGMLWLPANISIASSVATLTATAAASPNTGAAISTHGKVALSAYGYIESRVRLNGTGGWGSFWLTSHDSPGSGGAGTEWDLLEQRSFAGGDSTEIQIAYHSAAHDEEQHPVGSFGNWIVVGANWQPGNLKVYYDGALQRTITTDIPVPGSVSAPGMYVILNNATSFVGTQSGSTFDVDYLRYWTGG